MIRVLLYLTLPTFILCAAPTNVLFITVDDMNRDSVGAFGCPLPGITPHLDQLAKDGFCFDQAFVQAPNCSPSRNVFQTGRYPHVSGVRGFYNATLNFPILPEVLKANGYFTGVLNKGRDSSPNNEFDKYWDVNVVLKGGPKRAAASYGKLTADFLARAKEAKKPFYCVVNIADPHKPFYNDPKSKSEGFDDAKPSKFFTAEEVSVPPSLPDLPKVRTEMRNYYNSVKRADDCVGAILSELDKTDVRDQTMVIFISDHGMPLPFAKSSLYPAGVATPWIVRHPGKVPAGQRDGQHFISAIDFMPTILDVANIPSKHELSGRSILPIMAGKNDAARDHVFVQFDENAGGEPRPMRAIHTADYCYVYNAWSVADYEFKSASMSHATFKTMKVSKDPSVQQRLQYLLKRTPEELYNVTKDPYALHNLAGDPAHRDVMKKLRTRLQKHLVATDDYVAEALPLRNAPLKRKLWMQKIDAEAAARAKVTEWKRFKNRAGGTGKNTHLFSVSKGE